MKWILLILFAIATTQIHSVCGKYNKGHLKKSENWYFIDKFCFDESGGVLKFTITDRTGVYDDVTNSSSLPPNGTVVAIYPDSETKWPRVYKSKMDCAWKVSQATLKIPADNNAHAYKIVGQRPRWWYIVVANCGANEIDVDYEISFTNEGGIFHHQFSKDTQGSYQIFIGFFWYLFALSILQGYLYYVCKTRKFHHQLIILIIISLAFKLASLGFDLVHCIKFSNDGIGVIGMVHTGLFWEMISQVTMLGIIAVLCKGYPVSTNYIYGKRLLAGLIGIFFLSYMILFIVYVAATNPISTNYVYDSIPGYIIIAIRIAAYFWTMRELYMTYRYENETVKKNFYIVVGWYSTFWFFSMPASVLAAHFVESWVRARIIDAIVNSRDAITFTILALMFRPSEGNKFFSVLNPNASVSFGNNKMQIFPMSGVDDQPTTNEEEN